MPAVAVFEKGLGTTASEQGQFSWEQAVRLGVSGEDG